MNIQRARHNNFPIPESHIHLVSTSNQLQNQKVIVKEYDGHSIESVAISDRTIASTEETTSTLPPLPDDWKENLQKAASDGKASQLQILLQQGADANGCTTGGDTPLFKAAANGHSECVRLLLNYNAEPDAKASAHKTPLYWAAKKGYDLIVNELIFRGAEVNAHSKGRNTPLSQAAYSNHVKTVRTLIRAGAEVNGCSAGFKAPIYWAASLEKLDSLFELLLNNAKYENENMIKEIVDKYNY